MIKFGASDRPVSFFSRGDTAHVPLIQVATPNLGNIQRLMTIQAARNPIMIKASVIDFFRSTLLHLAIGQIEYLYLFC